MQDNDGICVTHKNTTMCTGAPPKKQVPFICDADCRMRRESGQALGLCSQHYTLSCIHYSEHTLQAICALLFRKLPSNEERSKENGAT